MSRGGGGSCRNKVTRLKPCQKFNIKSISNIGDKCVGWRIIINNLLSQLPTIDQQGVVIDLCTWIVHSDFDVKRFLFYHKYGVEMVLFWPKLSGVMACGLGGRWRWTDDDAVTVVTMWQVRVIYQILGVFHFYTLLRGQRPGESRLWTHVSDGNC